MFCTTVYLSGVGFQELLGCLKITLLFLGSICSTAKHVIQELRKEWWFIRISK